MKRRINNIIKNIDYFTGIALAASISAGIVILNFFFIFRHISYDILSKEDYYRFQMILEEIFDKLSYKIIFLFLSDLGIMFAVIYFIVRMIAISHENIVNGLRKIKDGNLNFRIETQEQKYNELVHTVNDMTREYREKIRNMKECIDSIKLENSQCKIKEKCSEKLERLADELDRFNI